MIKKIRIYIVIGLYFMFIYFFVINPYFVNSSIDVISAILFLNFNTFERLGIDKFDMQYLIMFILFYHIIIYPKLSELSNNSSLGRMSLHKVGKRQQLFRRVSETLQ